MWAAEGRESIACGASVPEHTYLLSHPVSGQLYDARTFW